MIQDPLSAHGKALTVLRENRVAIFIVAYNAERHIENVLNRIPDWIAENLAEIFVIDDCSTDRTVAALERYPWSDVYAPLNIYKTNANQGYGGNQKIGFSYAIRRNFDLVVLLHGDGQYAPEAMPEILAPYADGAQAVFGSRFLTPRAALRGGMPLYKFIGNRILTRLQNAGMGARLSEWHSGYRSYRVELLKNLPFLHNGNGFEFDGEIIIQALGSGYDIVEVPIPTFYGDEICRVNGLKYAWKCVKAIVTYKFTQGTFCRDPKFELRFTHGSRKLANPSHPGRSCPYGDLA